MDNRAAFSFQKTMEVLKKVDPAVLQRRWPTPALEKEYNEAHRMTKHLFTKLQSMDAVPTAIDDATYIDIQRAADALRAVAKKLDAGTEIGSRGTAYEAVLLYAAGYAERAIYLAGVANDRGLREPFATQLRCLPADSCIMRFRQLHRVREYLADEAYINDAGIQGIAEMLRQMQMSLASQCLLFSDEAYVRNGSHPYAAYLKCLSLLLRSYMLADGSGRSKEAKALQGQAKDVIYDLREPTDKLHVAEVRYHILNYEEFTTFKRLARSHSEITNRLKHLHGRATEIQENGRARSPALSYPIIPWVVGGLRCASLLGIASLISAIAGVNAEDFRACADDVWGSLGSSVDGLLREQTTAVALAGKAGHGGGVISVVDGLARLAMGGHGGGIV